MTIAKDATLSPTSSRIMRVHVNEPGPHTLEILTREEWLDLEPEERPAEFYRHAEDCYIRMRPE